MVNMIQIIWAVFLVCLETTVSKPFIDYSLVDEEASTDNALNEVDLNGTSTTEKDISHIMKIPKQTDKQGLVENIVDNLNVMELSLNASSVSVSNLPTTTEVTKDQYNASENIPSDTHRKAIFLKQISFVSTSSKTSNNVTFNVTSRPESSNNTKVTKSSVVNAYVSKKNTTKVAEELKAGTLLPETGALMNKSSSGTVIKRALSLESYEEKVKLQKDIIEVVKTAEGSIMKTNSASNKTLIPKLTVSMKERNYTLDDVLSLLNLVHETIKYKFNLTNSSVENALSLDQSLNVNFNGKNYTLSEVEDLEILLLSQASKIITLPDMPMESVLPILKMAFGKKANVLISKLNSSIINAAKSNIKSVENLGNGKKSLMLKASPPYILHEAHGAASSLQASTVYFSIAFVTLTLLFKSFLD